MIHQHRCCCVAALRFTSVPLTPCCVPCENRPTSPSFPISLAPSCSILTCRPPLCVFPSCRTTAYQHRSCAHSTRVVAHSPTRTSLHRSCGHDMASSRTTRVRDTPAHTSDDDATQPTLACPFTAAVAAAAQRCDRCALARLPECALLTRVVLAGACVLV